MFVCILLSTYHKAAPLLGVADAEHDDGEEDGAHGDPGHKGPGDDGLLHVSLPSRAVEDGAVVSRHGVLTNFAH